MNYYTMSIITITSLRANYRLFDMALFDWIGTFIGANLVAKVLQRIVSPSISTLSVVLLAPLIGVLVHVLVGQDTMFNYYLGLNAMPKR